MGEVQPVSNPGDAAMLQLKQTPDGKLLCPAGYPLRKIDSMTWRCEGGHHEYRLDEETMILDKFGHYWVKSSNSSDMAEMKQQNRKR